MIRRLEEHATDWSWARVLFEALATCMAIIVLLHVWVQQVGPL